MDPLQFLADLDAGLFTSKIGAAIKDAAVGCINHDKKGQVVITLGFERIGNASQVMVEHKLAFARPTARGKVTEEDTTQTPMHVNKDGSVTVFPLAQGDLFKHHQTEETE